ncbi:MAG: aminopeptidase P family protein [Clostridiales bacterium]|nr:aminopeptidase P family protein [Clostridiales bacterium]
MDLEMLARKMPEALDGIFITSECNIFYLTGFECDAAVMLISRNGSVFFTDSRYIEAARKKIKCCEIENTTEIKTRLNEYCKKWDIKRLGAEAGRITVADANKYLNMLEGVEFVFGKTTDSFISSFRSVKTGEEIKLINEAQGLAEFAFDHIKAYIEVGMTEREVQLELDHFMLKNGADDLSFKTIVVSGKNSSMPHGVPSDKKIEKGDLITLDFGAVIKGYHSDMTRTVAAVRFGDREKEIYEIVRRAQEKALAAVKPGMLCRDIDYIARKVIEDAGYGEYFGHSLGHGVGVEIHEEPSVGPKSEAVLEVGNVITIEPGIYIPGEFGVRIEDMVAVSEDGCYNFTKCSKDFVTVG